MNNYFTTNIFCFTEHIYLSESYSMILSDVVLVTNVNLMLICLLKLRICWGREQVTKKQQQSNLCLFY